MYRLPNADGYVFDFNGTLFWDEKQNREAWDETVFLIRGSRLSDDEFAMLNGRNDTDTVRYLLPDADAAVRQQWADRKEMLYKEICLSQELSLSPGSIGLLEALRSRGARMAIASSAPKCNMDWYIPEFRLCDYFSRECIIAGREDIPSKPDGAIFRLALDAIGVSGCHAAAFEDSRAGVLSAMDAGIRTVMRMRDPEAEPLDIPGIIEIRSFSEISLQ